LRGWKKSDGWKEESAMHRHFFRKNQCSFIPAIAAILLFLPLAAGRAQQTQSSSPSEGADLVRLRATVLNHQGRVVPLLNRDDFSVYLEKAPQQISHFSNEDEPASIVILVDLSGSMQTSRTKINRFSYLVQVAQRFIQLSNVSSEYSIISFSREPRLVLDWSRDPQEVFRTLANLAAEKAKGVTAVRNACQAGVRQAATGAYSKRVLLLFSDGQDTSAIDGIKSISQKELKQLLLEKEIQFYAINPGTVAFSRDDARFLGLVEQEGMDYLDSLARLSGGRAYHPQNPLGMQQAAEAIATELRHQYLITFTPASASANSKSFKVKVRPSPEIEKRYGLRGVSVRHREEFFSGSGSQPVSGEKKK
jgi:VWFA-related protein